MRLLSAVTALVAAAAPASAFYLPGSAPHDYKPGEDVPVYVNSLTPKLNTTLRSLISLDYYDERFHFCQPDGGPQQQAESLGSILFGDRILSSAFSIKMLEDKSCVTLCKATVPKEDAKFINERIEEDYGVSVIIDGLPSAELMRDPQTQETFLDAQGFALGEVITYTGGSQKTFLNNHYDIYIDYHKRDEEHVRVVGVVVHPRSVDSMVAGEDNPNCYLSEVDRLALNEDADNTFYYTYTVKFRESETPWGLRWDSYLHVYFPKIHWFSLINSLVIAGFLCFMVTMVLFRTISKDIHRYNAIDLAEDVQEDFGWKLVHGEVFRSPERPMLLSVSTGTGAHLVLMCAVTLVFALFGFLSPSNRGSLATVLLICWMLFGCVGGYVSARVFATLGGETWKANLVMTATVFPAIVFTLIGVLNIWLVFAHASGAVPFGTILAILLLWFLISVPLSVAGYFLGMKHGGLGTSTRVNSIPRQIPPQPWYLRPVQSAVIAGILPFGAAFVELYFVLSSLFGNHAYYAFGFLFLTFLVFVLTTATVTFLVTYFVLCAEEYRWHWRAFLVGGGSALWVFLYGIWYFASRLSFGSFTSLVLYFGYLFLFSLLTFLVGGSIGFVTTFFGVRKLYSSIRVD